MPFLTAVSQSSELVALGSAGGQDRFTSRDMIEAEKSLLRRAASMAEPTGARCPLGSAEHPVGAVHARRLCAAGVHVPGERGRREGACG